MSMIQPNSAILGLSLHAGNSEWDMIGPVHDPSLLLAASWTINKVLFHVEAYRVCLDETWIIDSDDTDNPKVRDVVERFRVIKLAFLPDPGFQTIKLDDEEYVLVIFPFSK